MSRFARVFKGSPLPVLWYKSLNALLRLRPPVSFGVRVLLVRDPGPAGIPEVLLVKHSYRPGWYLPGGGVKRWERLDHAARREAREEAGIEIETLEGPIGVFANFVPEKSDHVLLYRGLAWRELPHGHERSLEIAEVCWAPLDALPQDTAPGTRRRIEEFLGVRAANGEW